MTFYKLKLLDSNAFVLYEKISKSKHGYRDILIGEKQQGSNTYTYSTTYHAVKSCYDEYEKLKNELNSIVAHNNFNDDEKDALLHCYTGNTKLVKDLKKNIIDAQNIHYQTKCAYCGIGDIHCMDHYLPKDSFPEFAVHKHNLIPSCNYCNEKKSTIFLDKNQNRMIFNPYFEALDANAQILKCVLECYDLSVTAKLTVDDGIASIVCSNHLSRLELISIFQDQIPRKLSSVMFDLISNAEEYGHNIDSAKRVMKRKLNNEFEKIQGVNSLDAIIYRAYLENDKLFDIDYIRQVYKKLVAETVAS